MPLPTVTVTTSPSERSERATVSPFSVISAAEKSRVTVSSPAVKPLPPGPPLGASPEGMSGGVPLASPEASSGFAGGWPLAVPLSELSSGFSGGVLVPELLSGAWPLGAEPPSGGDWVSEPEASSGFSGGVLASEPPSGGVWASELLEGRSGGVLVSSVSSPSWSVTALPSMAVTWPVRVWPA